MAPKKKARLRARPDRAKGWPLCDKYAPRSTDELTTCVYAPTVKRVREWVDAAVAPVAGSPRKRLLVLCGAPGIGKSTIVDVVCAELAVEVLRWHDTFGSTAYESFSAESDYRQAPYESQLSQWQQFIQNSKFASLDTRRAPATPQTQQSWLKGPAAPVAARRRAVLLLDEIPDPIRFKDDLRETLEGLAGDDDVAPAILVWSEGIAEKAEAKYVVTKALGCAGLLESASVECIECNDITEAKTVKLLEAILAAEGASSVGRPQMEQIATEAGGDVRRAISLLEFAMKRRLRPAGGCSDDSAGYGVVSGSSDGSEGARPAAPVLNVAKGRAAVGHLHAINRLLRCKRLPCGRLDFDPEEVMERMAMCVDAAAAFLQFNSARYFTDSDDLAEALEFYSSAELFAARQFSADSGHDRGDAVFPQRYASSLAARASAPTNRHPAPPTFAPVKEPMHYRIRRQVKLQGGEIDLDRPAALASRGNALGRPGARGPRATAPPNTVEADDPILSDFED